jgi:PKHD-type hydroxylase
VQFSFGPQALDNYSQWSYYQKAFTPEECQLIKTLFKRPEVATIGVEGNKSPEEIRKSSVCWIPFTEDVRWIYQKLSDFILPCNKGRYGFDLHGFGEPLQLGRYQQGDHYQWHQDNGPEKFSTRKLSIVLQLSKPEDYKGGELQFFGYESDKVCTGQGDLILFPSFNPHRVTQITEGERYSLVAWISGPPFR